MDQFRRPHDDKDEDPRSSAFIPPSIIRPESASAFSKPILPSSSSLLSPKHQFGAPIASNGGATASPASAPDPLTAPSPAGTRYRECLRNHAASLGGHVIDGCGEFMPAGPADPLKCAACGCHRSFHRKEAPLPPPEPDSINPKQPSAYRVPLLLPPANPIRFSGNTTDQSSSEEKNTNNSNPTSTDHHYNHHRHGEGRKKRFRTKFSSEQKERMREFADRVGWRVQKKDEGEMERFCGEIGVSRQVLKVWMHNNKHLVKRSDVKMEPSSSMQLHHNNNQEILLQHHDHDRVDGAA